MPKPGHKPSITYTIPYTPISEEERAACLQTIINGVKPKWTAYPERYMPVVKAIYRLYQGHKPFRTPGDRNISRRKSLWAIIHPQLSHQLTCNLFNQCIYLYNQTLLNHIPEEFFTIPIGLLTLALFIPFVYDYNWREWIDVHALVGKRELWEVVRKCIRHRRNARGIHHVNYFPAKWCRIDSEGKAKWKATTQSFTIYMPIKEIKPFRENIQKIKKFECLPNMHETLMFIVKHYAHGLGNKPPLYDVLINYKWEEIVEALKQRVGDSRIITITYPEG